ncbi:hypothetical protein BCR43DRAFT_540198 [Syncephalastrum racemosum]|uniref:Uncharacterized protein n=1 Tax=Syncephalastrum racemosum TaxID=13706 RepID=A0A1X2HLP6_SYNRA|nr:hypothetical protein BCR43DRAFT_540198 [Syncephalastrum racemosum]
MSMKGANILAESKNKRMIARYDVLHQLRQVRTRVDVTSTYTICRSSSSSPDDHHSHSNRGEQNTEGCLANLP